MRPRLNVIIPTRERADTLIHSLRTVVEQDYDDVQIIVSDNFSQDHTRQVVESFGDSRIKYLNTGRRISMSHNWEFALSHVTNGWVTFLGDDDGLLPGGLALIGETISQTDCRAITTRWCHYFWPNTGDRENTLSVPLGGNVERRRGKEWLRKLLRGNASYTELPWLYTGGFAEVGLINSARASDGNFFLSMTPDIYSAVALASVADEYLMLEEPVSIAGVSKHSNGASFFGQTNDAGPAKKYFSENNIPFHPLLCGQAPKSIALLTYECYLQAAHLRDVTAESDLSRQLAIAIYLAPKRDKLQTRADCMRIALANAIPERTVSKNLRRVRCLLFTHKYVGTLRTVVHTARFGVSNVGDAARLAWAIRTLDQKLLTSRYLLSIAARKHRNRAMRFMRNAVDYFLRRFS